MFKDIKITALGKGTKKVHPETRTTVNTHTIILNCDLDLSQCHYSAIAFSQESVHITLNPAFSEKGNYIGTELRCYVNNYYRHVFMENIAEYDWLKVIEQIPDLNFKSCDDESITGLRIKNYQIVGYNITLGFRVTFVNKVFKTKRLMVEGFDNIEFYFILYTQIDTYVLDCDILYKKGSKVMKNDVFSVGINSCDIANHDSVVALCERYIKNYIQSLNCCK